MEQNLNWIYFVYPSLFIPILLMNSCFFILCWMRELFSDSSWKWNVKSERKFISQKYYQWSHCSKLSFLDLQKNYCSRLSSRIHLNEWDMRIEIYKCTYESYLRNFCSTPSFPVLRWSCCSKLSYQTHRWSCCSIFSCQDLHESCCSRLFFLTNIHQLSQRTCCINNPKQCLCNSSSFKILSSAERRGVRETWLE